MQDCKPVGTLISTSVKLGKDEDSEKVNNSTYRRLIGSFLYLTANRSNIPFVESFLSRFMHLPKNTYFTRAKECQCVFMEPTSMELFSQHQPK